MNAARPPLRFPRLALLPLLVAAGAACAALVQRPEVEIEAVRLHAVGLGGGTVRVELRVMNPNRFSLDARSMEYTFAFVGPDAVGPGGPSEVPDTAWQVVATGRTARDVVLAARDTVPLSVDIPFTYRDVGRAVGSLLREGRLHYRLHGSFAVGSPVGELRIPFDRSGLLDP